MLNNKLKIAWIGHGWDGVFQRPHHWQKQALLRGHEFHVYTMPARLSQIVTNFFHDSSSIHRLRYSFYEYFLFRAKRFDELQQRKISRFEKYIHKEVIKQCGNKYDVVIYGTIPTKHFNREGSSGIIIYDCMDEWSGFSYSQPEVAEWELTLASQSDIILAVSLPLFRKFADCYGEDKVLLVPNGCDYDFFASSINDRSKRKEMIIGYTGAIDNHNWFDWNTVKVIANAFPKASVYLIGPAVRTPVPLPKNIILGGRQPYERMPIYNSTFDVGIIPFFVNSPLIAAASPIKLYEYLATGIPVVSSPMPDSLELAERGIVHIADSPEAFAREISEAYKLSKQPELVKRRLEIARKHSWATRWQMIEKAVMDIRNN
ncbi:MAG: glycosyltransferase [Nitrospirae bacterium]|nr:glycosyltransferase [Nitrospirota bacterium]